MPDQPAPHKLPRILTIAGSDCGGGAGIQADLKVITCLGGYGMSAITALTAQDTRGVWGIHAVPPEFVAQQVELCLADIGVDVQHIDGWAFKTMKDTDGSDIDVLLKPYDLK